MAAAYLSAKNCIIWDNAAGSIQGAVGWNIRHSCVQGWESLPEERNIASDPKFVGWGEREEVYVDAANPLPGDGTPTNPYRSLGDAFQYDLALSEDSPCRGTGGGGANMGAPLGVGGRPGKPGRLNRVAPGTHRVGGFSLAHGVSLEGAGRDRTILEGCVRGLRTGRFLSKVTVAHGPAGIEVPPYEAPTISDCAIRENGPEGGVVCGEGSRPTLRGCVITGNTTYNLGGGVRCSRGARPILFGCTILGNKAGSGGGLWCTGGSMLINCVIAGNVPYYGAAISCSGLFTDPPVVLINCTISANQTTRALWLECKNTYARLVNCIVWNNSPSDSSYPGGTFESCLVGVDPLFARPGLFDFYSHAFVDIIGLPGQVWEPRFVVEEPDFHLGKRSPAIDAGSADEAPEVDIEGKPRPCGARVDVGAYEYGRCPRAQPFVRGDANLNSSLDISDAIYILLALFLSGVESFWCPDAADVNDDGVIDISDPLDLLTYLVRGGAPPPAPTEAPGPDPTPDALGCYRYAR